MATDEITVNLVNGDSIAITIVDAGVSVSSGVSQWNGRTGAVVPLLNDYDASLVNNDSTVAGATVSAALEALQAQIDAL